MPEYVIERDVPGAGQFTEEQIREVSLRSLAVLKGIGPQIQWLHSYVTDDRIYCVYLAPDEDTVREHARQTGIPAKPGLRGAAARRSETLFLRHRPRSAIVRGSASPGSESPASELD